MAQPNIFGVTEFDQDPETAAELMRLRKQQQIADAMMGQSQQPLQGGMAGNVYVAPSITQGLAKMFQGYSAGRQSADVMDQYKKLAADRRAMDDSERGKVMEVLIGRPEQPMGPPTEAGEMGVSPARPAGTRNDVALAMMASKLPDYKKAGFQMYVTEGARKEDRAAAREDKLFQIQMAHQNNLEKIKADALERRITREEADRRANESKEQMIRLAAGLRQEPAPTVTEIVQNGKLVKVDARSGRVIGESPAVGKGKAMTPTAQKELIQTDEEIQGGQAALTALNQAMAINDSAMGFKGAGVVSSLGTLLPEGIRPAAVDATENLDNILTAGALPQLKAIFGGMPTEGERKVLLEIQGSSSKPPAVRKQIFERAMEAANKRIAFAQKKAKSLREGSYFSGDGGMETPSAPIGKSAVDAALEKYK